VKNGKTFSPPESPAELAKRLSLPFGDDLRLLTRALTHTSYLNEYSDAPDDNERLEFLGDAVLDFVVAAWLYRHCPEMREGALTQIRSSLVRTEQLAEFARQIELGRALRLGRGERNAGGQDRPALLCAAFEALIGAIYLQAGIPAVEAFFYPFLEASREKISDILAGVQISNPKSVLQEWTQANHLGIPRYKLVGESGPDHAKTFEVEVFVDGKRYGIGRGSSKNAAEQEAARDALRSLS
jgi:ribonuclease-3